MKLYRCNCKSCGLEFKATGVNTKYCEKCNTLEKTCAECNKIFYVANNVSGRNKQFCCMNCTNARRYASEEYKKAVSERSRKQWTDPVYRQKCTDSANKAWNNQERRKAMSEFHKEYQNRPDVKEMQSKRSKEHMNKPEVKEAITKFWKENKSNPDVKKATSEFQKEYQNRADVKAARKEYSDLPEVKAARSKSQKEAQNKPELKKYRSEMYLKLWADPDYAVAHIHNGYKRKDYTFPSGKVISIQGSEHMALDELLKSYDEADIVVGVREIYEHIGRIKYSSDNDKIHTYYPDFYIKSTNTVVEVKSSWTYNKELDKNISKRNACLCAGLNFCFMIYSSSVSPDSLETVFTAASAADNMSSDVLTSGPNPGGGDNVTSPVANS